MPIAFIFSLLFSVLVVVFALQNSAMVTINVLFAELTMSQALVILISAIFGAIIVLLLSTIKQISSSMKIRNLTKTISKLEEEAKLLKEKDRLSKEKYRLSKEKEEQLHMEKLEEENKLLKEKEEL